MPKTQVKKEPLYKIALKVNNEIIRASADTLLDAIRKIEPLQYKTYGVITIQKGEKKSDRFLPIPKMKRLFGPNDKMRQVITKYLDI